METIKIVTKSREEMIDITSIIRDAISRSDINSGYIICTVPSLSAAISINDRTDEESKREHLHKLRQEIPEQINQEGSNENSPQDDHDSITGEQIMFKRNKLLLGETKNIYFCELGGPRKLELNIKVLPLV